MSKIERKYFVDTEIGSIEYIYPNFEKLINRGKDGLWGFVDRTKEWVKISRVVDYKIKGTKHKCDSRCQSARGRTMNCECACGGKNHGKS